jgi:DNA-binding NarL/FixJ family response regulator
MITLLLAEDAPIIRSALRSMLERMSDVSVVGDVAVAELVETARRLQPDVVVMSAIDPRPPHQAFVKGLSKLPNRPGVIYLSTYKHVSFLREFFMNGGAACVLTNTSVSTVHTAIRRAAAGRNYIDPDVSDEIVVALVGDRGRPRGGVLSKREEETLRLHRPWLQL